MTSEPTVHDIFESNTGTWQYIVADPHTKSAVIIDPVLDYNAATKKLSSSSADALLLVVQDNGYQVDRILETHIHADHVTAAKYLQQKLEKTQNLKPAIGIGKRVRQVQERFGEKYGVSASEYSSAFDHLFDDDEIFEIGDMQAKALHLPGHTPDHLGYQIGANVFCGDSLFNHDVGSARCDFPGGSAPTLYQSVRKLLSLPGHYKIWTGHDYPPGGEGRTVPLSATTVEKQNKENKHLKEGVSGEEFIKWREERDATLAEPKLINTALQFNIRAGGYPTDASNL